MTVFGIRELVLLGVLSLFYPVGALKNLRLMLVLQWSGTNPIGPHMGAAFPVALQDVQSRREFSNLTIRFNITWDVYDSGCDNCDSLNVTITNLVKQKAESDVQSVFIFGVAFDCEYVALVAAAFDVQVISPLCFDTRLESSLVYTTFSRTIGSGTYWTTSLLLIAQKFGWERIAVVISDDEALSGTLDELELKLRDKGFAVDEIHVTRDDVHSIRSFADKDRVFILLLRDMQTVFNVLDMANSMKILDVKDYTFILIQFRYDTEYLSVEFDKLYARTNGILCLSVQEPLNEVEWQKFKIRVAQAYAEDPHFAQQRPNSKYTSVIASASYLYEAVMLWATVLNKAMSLPPGPDFENLSGARLTSMMKNIKFEGVGRTRIMDNSGNIYDNFTLTIVQNQQLVPLATFEGRDGQITADFGALDASSDIVWAGKSRDWPPGKPSCGWNDPDCVQRDRFRLIVILCAVFFVSALLLAFVFVFLCRFLKGMSHKSDDISIWIVDWSHVHLLQDRPSARRSTITGTRKSIAMSGLRYMKEHADWFDSDSSKSTMESDETSAHSFYQHLFISAATIDNTKVAIKRVPHKNYQPDDKSIIDDIEQMKHLRYENLNEFVGICLNADNPCILMIYAVKGSLMDVLRDATINLSWDFKFPLACDISKGMAYLHKSELGSHGHLTSHNCLVDSRWVCKITDYGMGHFREPPLQQPYTNDECHALLWTAPELLRQESVDRPMYGTKSGDVYSFGIIMQEITLRERPFRGRTRPDLTPSDILDRVSTVETPPFRPVVPTSQCKKNWCILMESCWDEDPMTRPTFVVVIAELQTITENKSMNVADNMLRMLEKHAENLEELIQERQAQLDIETKRVETILNNIFPKSVVTQLMRGEHVMPETFQSVTIYFSDIFGFTEICSQSTPMQIIDLLNSVYNLFDAVTDTYDVYKVETINDSYLVASGLPIRNTIHATEIATMAIDLLKEAGEFKIEHLPNDKLLLRIGINSGTVVAGVVGLQQPRYCIFGDTVNTASRMESSGLPLQIHITTSTARLLRNNPKFRLDERGESTVKGKGKMMTYWLTAGPSFVHPKRASKNVQFGNKNSAAVS